MKTIIKMKQCYWCHEADSIIFFNVKNKDADKFENGPHMICIDAEPCQKCAEKFKLGITVFGVVNENQNHKGYLRAPNAKQELYLTGTYAVMAENSNFIQNLPEGIRENVLKTKSMYLDEPCLQDIISQNDKLLKEGEAL